RAGDDPRFGPGHHGGGGGGGRGGGDRGHTGDPARCPPHGHPHAVQGRDHSHSRAGRGGYRRTHPVHLRDRRVRLRCPPCGGSRVPAQEHRGRRPDRGGAYGRPRRRNHRSV